MGLSSHKKAVAEHEGRGGVATHAPVLRTRPAAPFRCCSDLFFWVVVKTPLMIMKWLNDLEEVTATTRVFRISQNHVHPSMSRSGCSNSQANRASDQVCHEGHSHGSKAGSRGGTSGKTWLPGDRGQGRIARIRLHDLRHGSATMALVAGVPAKIVQERLGHANISVTMDIYSPSDRPAR